MSGIRPDGYYICDYAIDCVHFVSDSILMLLVNKQEVRIVYIPDFLPNSYWYEGDKIKKAEDEKEVNKKLGINKYLTSLGEKYLRELSRKSELEFGTTLLDGNIKYSVTAEKQNFNQTITVNENHIIVLGQEKILSAKLYYWEDYLKYVQKHCDWLV